MRGHFLGLYAPLLMYRKMSTSTTPANHAAELLPKAYFALSEQRLPAACAQPSHSPGKGHDMFQTVLDSLLSWDLGASKPFLLAFLRQD